jgi:flagellar basal body P-ring formation protein FlgA
MVKSLFTISGLILVGALALAQPAQSQDLRMQELRMKELRVKADVIVTGDVVRFDHLIEGIGPRGEMPAFRAPAPGTRGTIKAERIVQAAREIGILDLELGGLRAVTIFRPGRMISREEMQDAILRQISDRKPGGETAIQLDDAFMARPIDAHRLDGIKVTSLTKDARTGRFEARLALIDAKDGNEAWMVAGMMTETREIAVPVSDIERGDAIQAKDLVMVKRPASQVGSDIQAQMSDLVGMVPRRALRAGEFIRNADIAKPIWVEKNQVVSVVYEQNGISLSMRGRAQQSGAEGDMIKVQNPQSKRLVEGVVSGPGKVSVSQPAPQPAVVAETGRTESTSRLTQ